MLNIVAMRLSLFVALSGFFATGLSARFVEFSFGLDGSTGNPFQRDIRAAVVVPEREKQWYPAFYDGEATWKVRVRAGEAGEYRIEGVAEWNGAERTGLDLQLLSDGSVTVAAADPMPAVGIDPEAPTLFRKEDDSPYLPLGMNIAWGWGDFFETAFPALAQAGLNWGRIWMTHWSGTNLDWVEGDQGVSPAPGSLDLGVARKWDGIIELAESNRIWIQVVLQHHGQFSTEVNPNWEDNPWNVVNGGFLENPADFFTSEEARRLTRWKYRTIIARYGHSPAVLAWELFNEVFGTDAYRVSRDEASIAAWHDEMAAWIRDIDPYGHLVTTSHDHLSSPIYASMDYYQPHLYGLNMLAHVRRFPDAPDPLDKPLFYGEVGDTSMLFPQPEDLDSGVGLVPHLWAGLLADRALPAQAWFWDRLLGTPRMLEMTSLAAFVTSARLAETWGALEAFTPSVESGVRVPHILTAGMNWGPRPVLEWSVDGTGREEELLADVPHYVVRDPVWVERGFPDRLILRIEGAEPRTLKVELDDVGASGLTLLVLIGDRVVRDLTWPTYEKTDPEDLRPASFEIDVPSGEQVVTIRNFGPGTVRLREIDLDAELPALAALGKRSADRVVLYLFHRTQVHSATLRDPASGEVILEGLPQGRWTVTWWDMDGEAPSTTEMLEHSGGSLRLATPPVARHVAVLLEKSLSGAD